MLAEYAQTGSDAAFRELVNRYVDLVYSTAIRLVEGDTHRAQDVAQVVFVDLARAARSLSSEVMLGGWLHRHTVFVAAKTMRGERRRQLREREAVEMNALQNETATDFSLVAPILDEAINGLGEADRTAVLLRFFEQHDFRSVGHALGSNEDAARMRVTRALEKLQDLLKRRGVVTSAASLSVLLSASAIQAAPTGLAATLTGASLMAATAGAGSSLSLLKLIPSMKLLMLVVGMAVTSLVTPLLIQRQSQRRGQDGVARSRTSVDQARNPSLITGAFAAVPESAIPGRYRWFQARQEKGTIILYPDHTFENEKGEKFAAYRWELNSNELVLQWQSGTTRFNLIESPGVYTGVRTDNRAQRLEKIE